MKPVRYWDKKTDLVVSLQGGDRYSVPLYAIPEGYKLVPIEPTEEMIEEFINAYSNGFLTNKSIKPIVSCSYKAMIEVAPEIEDKS